MSQARTSYACPRCGAKPNEHGTGKRAKEECRWSSHCEGCVCNCDPEVECGETHGETQIDPCIEACCGCCGWGGRLPELPKKMLPWERKALESGWTPPEGWNPSDRPIETKGSS